MNFNGTGRKTKACVFAPVWSPAERRCVETDICGEVEESERRLEGVVCVGRERQITGGKL